MSKNKGQIIGQVFVFVLAAIVLGAILLFGFNALKKIGETKEEVELITFQQRLSSTVDQVSLDFGSVRRLELALPPQYRSVCFIDLPKMRNPNFLQQLESAQPLIADAVRSGTDQNVFTVPFAETPIRGGAVSVQDPGFVCFENSDAGIILRLEGKGDRTEVGSFARSN